MTSLPILQLYFEVLLFMYWLELVLSKMHALYEWKTDVSTTKKLAVDVHIGLGYKTYPTSMTTKMVTACVDKERQRTVMTVMEYNEYSNKKQTKFIDCGLYITAKLIDSGKKP